MFQVKPYLILTPIAAILAQQILVIHYYRVLIPVHRCMHRNSLSSIEPLRVTVLTASYVEVEIEGSCGLFGT